VSAEDLERKVAEAESFLPIDLQRAVARLTLRQRQVLLLVHVTGMTEEQIASAIGVSHQAVNRLLKSSIQKLQKLFLVAVVAK